jgi:hypothetical protein
MALHYLDTARRQLVSYAGSTARLDSGTLFRTAQYAVRASTDVEMPLGKTGISGKGRKDWRCRFGPEPCELSQGC